MRGPQAEMRRWDGLHHFDLVAMGVGGKGQRFTTSKLTLPGTALHAPTSFRDRMFAAYGIVPRPWTARPRTSIKTIVVDNKRYTARERSAMTAVIDVAVKVSASNRRPAQGQC